MSLLYRTKIINKVCNLVAFGIFFSKNTGSATISEICGNKKPHKYKTCSYVLIRN